jgi:hypothetical protein
MILYHGSNMKIIEVDLDKCRPFKDFGRGFYLTEMPEQACQMAQRVARLYDGSPVVSKFKLDSKIYDDKTLRILSFEKPTREWALFVMNNRDRDFADVGSALCNQDDKYDMVFGPAPNDDIVQLFRTFRSGLIDVDALQRALEHKQLTNQYSFHTARALAYLKPESRASEKVKALTEGVTHDLVTFLVEDEKLTIEAAMDKVYDSILFDKLSDSETGLYRESAAYCYCLLKEELARGEFVQNEI